MAIHQHKWFIRADSVLSSGVQIYHGWKGTSGYDLFGLLFSHLERVYSLPLELSVSKGYSAGVSPALL